MTDSLAPLHRLPASRAAWLARLLFAVLAAAFVCGQEPALSPAPEGTFSVVVIPDTQGYRGRGTKATPKSADPVINPVFEAHVQWITANLAAQRVAFVSHVGDIVDINTADQWEVARRCLDQLHGKVPYAIAPGNHDMTGGGDSSLFQRTFPRERFAAFDWYGGCFEPASDGAVSANNANSFQRVTAGGVDLLFVHLECNAPGPVLDWANATLAQHSDRVAIVTTHMGLGPVAKPATNAGYATDPKGRMQWSKRHGARGNSPQQMWEKCFRRHRNLSVVFCGDQSRSTAMYQASVGDSGNRVHEFLSDYTSSGPLRLYRFDPRADRIRVITLDTTKGQLCETTAFVPAREQHQFEVAWERPGR